MFMHERFQAFCRWCTRVSEADSADAAIRAVIEHEKVCPKRLSAAEEMALSTAPKGNSE